MKERDVLTPNMLWVCIDLCTDTTFSGRIYSIVHEKALIFNDFVQFVLLADELFDEHGFPQAFQKKRSFIQEEDCCEELSTLRGKTEYDSCLIMDKKGELETLLILVESRAYSEWQGKLFSKEFELIQPFSDILVLSKAILKEIR